MIALVDCNGFYSACEQVFRPDLDHKGVVVLSNNDGCIIARNTRAKAMGIPMGAPFHQYQKILKKNQVAVFSSNFPLYANFSNRIMAILSRFSDAVEVYSIDEAFLSLEGHAVDLVSYGKRIQKTILKWTGIPVSIGIAPTKVLAKCANQFAKKLPESDGVFALTHAPTIDSALKQVKIMDVWGIGSKQSKKLMRHHIHTAHSFKRMTNRQLILSMLSKTGLQVHDELNGISCIDIQAIGAPKKSIRISRSFKSEITCEDAIAAALSLFATRAMEKLRKQSSMTQLITVFICKHPFKNHASQLCYRQSFGLMTATNDTVLVSKIARKLLCQLHTPMMPIKKAGIILHNLTPENVKQDGLFQKTQCNPLMKVMDQINQRFGKDSIQLATNLQFHNIRPLSQWISPRYTTSWHDLKVVQ